MVVKKWMYAIAALIMLYFLILGYQDESMYSSMGPFILISLIALLTPSYTGQRRKEMMCLGALFGCLIAFSNFDSLDMPGAICVALSASFIGYGCLEFIMNFSLNMKDCEKKWVYFLIFGLLTAAFVGYALIINYPGSVTIDASMSFEQIESNTLLNTHPFLYTLTLIPFKENFALYNVLQSIFIAGVISYGIATIKKPIVALPFFIIPYYTQWAQTMIKDTLFAGFVLLFIISLLRIIKKINGLNYLWLSIGIFGSSLYRLNGSIGILITLIIAAFLLRDKKFMTITFSVMAGTYAFKYGIPALLSLKGSSITESTTLLQQQIAAALLVEDDKELLKEADKFLSLDRWQRSYEPFYGDSIKYILRSNNRVDSNFADYLNLWFKLGARHPLEYMAAFVRNTRFYYNGAYVNDLRFWTVANKDMPGIATSVNILSATGLIEPTHDPYLKTFLSIDVTKAVGLNTWVLGALYAKGRLERRKETLILIPFIVLLFTNILFAPVPEFRYMLPLFFALPIIFIGVGSSKSMYPLNIREKLSYCQ